MKWAEKALKKGKKAKVRQYLTRLRQVNPESSKLAVLESQLESMSTPTTVTLSQPSPKSSISSQPFCFFPDAPKSRAPGWICNPSTATDLIMAVVGSTNKIANRFLMERQCVYNARLSMVKTLTDSANVYFIVYATPDKINFFDPDSFKLSSDMMRMIKEMIKEPHLPDTSLKKYATSPKNTFYCLVGMEAKKYKVAGAKTSMDNKRSQSSLSCVYPDDPKYRAPEWICNPSVVSDAYMTARGSAKKVANRFTMKRKCLFAAWFSIAQTVHFETLDLDKKRLYRHPK